MGKHINKIDKKIIDTFMAFPWPGNIRELQNVIERMMNYCKGNELIVDLIPIDITVSRSIALEQIQIESPEDVERKMIDTLLQLKFRKNKIAEKMNISRAALYNKLKKYNLF